MGNLIINFSIPSPAPVNGFKVYYKKTTDSSYSLLVPNAMTSPATIPVTDDTVNYTGYIQCDCGGGVTGIQTTFSASPCNNINQKIINGVCTQGTKAYTSSVASGSPLGTTYTCSYVYAFPDGSTTPIQTEINSAPCPLGGVAPQ